MPPVVLSIPRRFRALLLTVGAMACGANAPAPTIVAPSVSPAARALVDSLVVDEARMADRYDRVVRRFGVVPPFADLRDLPAARLDTLRAFIATERGWTPPDPFAGEVGLEVYMDVAGACDVSSRFAGHMLARYDRLLTQALTADRRAALRASRQEVASIDLSRTRSCD